VITSSYDAEESKPAPDIFEVALKKLGIKGSDAVAIGDTPYDAAAAGKVKIPAIGVLCGGFTEASLRQAGCVEVYPGPATLFARFADSLLALDPSRLNPPVHAHGRRLDLDPRHRHRNHGHDCR